MKRIVFLTCIGSLALALTAWGAPRGKAAQGSARGGGARSAHVVSAREVSLLRDLINMRSLQDRRPDPGHLRLESATLALQMPERLQSLAIAPRLAVRKVLLGQT